MSPLLLFVIFSLLSVTRAQYPHGLTHQNPMAFSPSAFEFFHPDNLQPSSESPCAASGCRPLHISATVQSSLAYESRSPPNKGGSRMTAGGIFGIVFGFVFVALLAMGVYYLMIKHHSNMSKSNSAQDEAWYTTTAITPSPRPQPKDRHHAGASFSLILSMLHMKSRVHTTAELRLK